MVPQKKRIPAAVLGATGLVGQRLVALLADHPWFHLAEVVASERSAGKSYGEAVHWCLPSPCPPEAAALVVRSGEEELSSRLVFSALDAGAAQHLEPLHARRGHLIVSNARSFRMHPQVPLLVPEVNPHAVELLEQQEWATHGGGIVTNPNCSVAGLVLALAPLLRTFGIESVVVATLQALSGAGYPGVPSLDALGNVIPRIPGEEEKIETEPGKILEADFPISAAAHRVPVADGHTEAVFVRLGRRASLEEVRQALEEFQGEPQRLGLPTAPDRPLKILDEPDRPQPTRDADSGGGMTVSIGRLRSDRQYDLRFTLLVHNTLRGAAGAALLNAELLAARGILGVRPATAVEAG